jgi:serine/threonine protein kinase
MANNKKHKVKFLREIQIMKEIQKNYGSRGSGAQGFPQLYHYEQLKDYFALVMERLGPSLKDIKEQVSKRFPIKNIIMIGMQLVSI